MLKKAHMMDHNEEELTKICILLMPKRMMSWEGYYSTRTIRKSDLRND